MFGWFTPKPKLPRLRVEVVRWDLEYPDWWWDKASVWMGIIRLKDTPQLFAPPDPTPPFKPIVHYHEYSETYAGWEGELPDGRYKIILAPRWVVEGDGSEGTAVEQKVRMSGESMKHVQVAFERAEPGAFKVRVTKKSSR